MATKWSEFGEGRKELARLYKSVMSGVPQDPKHHPEGDVLTHVRLVRKAIPKAIQDLQQIQTDRNNPLSDVFSEVSFRISPEEEQIVAAAAWLHDIGKPTATTIGGEPWQTPGVQGKIQALGHQEPNHYGPQIQRLQQEAPAETLQLYTRHQELINWLIEHHMDLSAGQFSRAFLDENFQNGRIINSQRMRLLLILMWADRMGRDPQTTMANIAKLTDKMVKSSQVSQNRTQRAANQSKPFDGTPEQFQALLRQRGLAPEQITQAMQSKFPRKVENFSRFYESAMKQGPVVIPADIPVDKELLVVKQALTGNFGDGGPSKPQLYLVGGAVRDFLWHQYHGDPKKPFMPKDYDLTTDLTEEQILGRLRTNGQRYGIKVKEKESVDTFGVVFVHVNGKDYEVAPFRRDVGTADGRRPERVESAGIEEDAMRRDLTMNNLYYDFEKKQILDLNENGQGIEDIKNMVTRTVGDPFERFNEDRLRVLRFIRFFSRFNPGDVRQFIDDRTAQAIQHFKDLPGISPERIFQEFLGGLSKSLNTSAYLHNYANLDLFGRVFPGLQVDVAGIDRLGNSKNAKVVLAWLLRNNGNGVAQALNRLKYPSEISDVVGFLISALKFQPDQAVQTMKARSRWLAKAGGPEQMSQDLLELAQVANRPDLAERLTHLAGQGGYEGEGDERQWKWQTEPYQPPKVSADEIMQREKIPQGPELGKAVDREMRTNYDSSWQEFLKRKSFSSPNPAV